VSPELRGHTTEHTLRVPAIPLCAYCHLDRARILPLRGDAGTVGYFCSVICAAKAAVEILKARGAEACSTCGTFRTPAAPCPCERRSAIPFDPQNAWPVGGIAP
jgi:hypothetical protein